MWIINPLVPRQKLLLQIIVILFAMQIENNFSRKQVIIYANIYRPFLLKVINVSVYVCNKLSVFKHIISAIVFGN